ncbi:MAG TPA: class I SAM-dependent methyltransferase [Nannocystis sp.]
MPEALPPLYTRRAAWFHLLTPPADYADEAAELLAALRAGGVTPPATLLELGAGGGNTASHYKRELAATLVDLSPEMLALSRTINPECEHVVGDMRTIRLERSFDAVLVHDAVMYMTSEADLRAVMATAHAHLCPGGVAVFMPDCTRETFAPGTAHGGSDAGERGLRYLEWTADPDPDDCTYTVDFALLLREGDSVVCEHERHVYGLFSQAEWLTWLEATGFVAHVRAAELGPVFVGVRPRG